MIDIKRWFSDQEPLNQHPASGLAQVAVQLAAGLRLRGADAVYVALLGHEIYAW